MLVPVQIPDEFITGQPPTKGTDPKDSKPGGKGWKPKPSKPGEKKPSVQYIINPDPETPAPLVEKVVLVGNVKTVKILAYKYSRAGTTTTSSTGIKTTTGTSVITTTTTTTIPAEQFITVVPSIKVPPNGEIPLPPGTRADVIKVILIDPKGNPETYTVIVKIHACIKPSGIWMNIEIFSICYIEQL